MGNWRTVNIAGSMSAADAAALRALLDTGRDYENWPAPEIACLAFSTGSPGLCGLGAWPAENVDARGNLFERGYSVEDVAGALRALVSHAPSMLLKVHCGGDYESEECVATISVGEGLVVAGPPEVEKVAGPSPEQVQRNLMVNLLR